jgi:cyclic pyranopterin phosphate synthase
MPAEGLPWMERAEILSFEEVERLVRAFVSLGVNAVRLTGGEPLIRRGFPRLVASLAGIPGLADLSVTTNGYLLERDAAALVDAGIQRVNVSIDSLQRDRFFQITRRDALPRVMRGLRAIGRHPEVRPVKVNAVAMRGFTEEEALRFAEFARSTDFQVRFIEFMPLDGHPDLLHQRTAPRRCVRHRGPDRRGAEGEGPRAAQGSGSLQSSGTAARLSSAAPRIAR